MFKWVKFRGEPKKVTLPAQAYEIVNLIFRKFFTTGSWFVYALALLFLVVGVIYYFIDEARKQRLLKHRREVRRMHERPPQRRRPGAASRNHEIYRSVMGKVKEYTDPSSSQTCVFRQTRSGTIYGQMVNVAAGNTDENISEQDTGNIQTTRSSM